MEHFGKRLKKELLVPAAAAAAVAATGGLGYAAYNKYLQQKEAALTEQLAVWDPQHKLTPLGIPEQHHLIGVAKKHRHRLQGGAGVLGAITGGVLGAAGDRFLWGSRDSDSRSPFYSTVAGAGLGGTAAYLMSRRALRKWLPS